MNERVNLISGDTTVNVSREIYMTDLDGEAIVLDVDTGKYYGLNEVGMRVLEMAEAEEPTVDEIVGALGAVYDVGHDQLRNDVVTFLKRMQELGLLHLNRTSAGEDA